MSVICYDATYTTSATAEADFWAEVTEKTDIEVTLGTLSSGTRTLTMKFPNMEAAQELKVQSMTGSDLIVIADVNNNFLVVTRKPNSTSYYQPNSKYMADWLKCLVFDNGSLVQGAPLSSSNQTTLEASANISSNAHDTTKDNITVIPLFWGNLSTNKGFVKNAYINYERVFYPGLKFADENGNEFLTLGGYLLYKTN